MMPRRSLLPVLGALAAVLCLPSAAGAGIENFSMSAASGPPGTQATVSGKDCSPGLLLAPSQDFVSITVTTSTAVSARLPVAANGSWSGTITIPTTALAGPAVVTALCVSDGLLSLLTVYLPKIFNVTSPAATTPPTSPVTSPLPPDPTTSAPPTTALSTPTSVAHAPRTTPSTPASTPTERPGHRPRRQPGTGSGGGTSRGGTGTSPGGTGNGGHGGTTPTATLVGGSPVVAVRASVRHHGRHGPSARAADLRSPTLAGAIDSTSGRLGWLGWLLALAAFAGLGMGGWLWWRRRGQDPSVSSRVPPNALT